MLVLTRKFDESVMIGSDIVVTVLSIRGDQVRLGISAPTDTPVHRQEVAERIQRGEPWEPSKRRSSETYNADSATG